MKPRRWDDSYARNEWGWSPDFTDINTIVADFVEEMKKHPELYQF
jgi:hypothetical protein